MNAIENANDKFHKWNSAFAFWIALTFCPQESKEDDEEGGRGKNKNGIKSSESTLVMPCEACDSLQAARTWRSEWTRHGWTRTCADANVETVSALLTMSSCNTVCFWKTVTASDWVANRSELLELNHTWHNWQVLGRWAVHLATFHRMLLSVDTLIYYADFHRYTTTSPPMSHSVIAIVSFTIVRKETNHQGEFVNDRKHSSALQSHNY